MDQTQLLDILKADKDVFVNRVYNGEYAHLI